VLEGFQVEVHQEDLLAEVLLELHLEVAQVLLLLLEEPLTAPVHTVRVPATARLTAPAHLTDQTLALDLTALVLPQVQFFTPQQQHLQEEGLMEGGTREGHRVQESMLCKIQDTPRILSHVLIQVPGAVRLELRLH